MALYRHFPSHKFAIFANYSMLGALLLFGWNQGSCLSLERWVLGVALLPPRLISNLGGIFHSAAPLTGERMDSVLSQVEPSFRGGEGLHQIMPKRIMARRGHVPERK
jgi:hypothetical protein